MSLERAIGLALVATVLLLPTSAVATHGPAHGAIFPTDAGTVAVFEFEGDALDSSGNARHLTPIETSPSYVGTPCGTAWLSPSTTVQGFDWSAFAGHLVAPYTVEMVLTPSEVDAWNKLFSHDDGLDAGWYIRSSTFNSFPSGALPGPLFSVGTLAYLAIVSTTPGSIDVYVDGAFAGTISAQFSSAPANAVFFRDDAGTSRSEIYDGTVDAMRISSTARTLAEMGAIMSQLDAMCPAPPVWTPELGSLVFVAVGALGIAGVVAVRRRA